MAYEALAQVPAQTLARNDDFIGEARFAHGFDNVECDAEDFDLAIGAPACPPWPASWPTPPHPTILPTELFQRFEGDAFWFDPSSCRHLQVIRRPRWLGHSHRRPRTAGKGKDF